MKKVILVLATALIALTGFAQEKGKFRFGFDFGAAIPKGGAGGLFAIEPKYNIADNMNVGLRIGAAAMARAIEYSESNDEVKAEVSANASYLVTYDYYLNSGGRSALYLGAGAGVYGLGNLKIDTSTSIDGLEGIGVTNKPGGMVRFGFESGKFRMGAEYNIIPSSDLVNVQNQVVGTSKNSFLGIHLGFYLGGGKWGN